MKGFAIRENLRTKKQSSTSHLSVPLANGAISARIGADMRPICARALRCYAAFVVRFCGTMST